MQILVDADACPKLVKEVLYRTAQRMKIETTLVANQVLNIPRSVFIKRKLVSQGFDAADRWIVEQCQPGDLVITGDIPLAYGAIAKGAIVISPTGVLMTEDNIRQRLSLRNFLEELRSGGENIGGPDPFSSTDIRNFANQLDKLLNKV